jgi:hypothetical protein
MCFGFHYSVPLIPDDDNADRKYETEQKLSVLLACTNRELLLLFMK